jgi:hypothetical protein
MNILRYEQINPAPSDARTELRSVLPVEGKNLATFGFERMTSVTSIQYTFEYKYILEPASQRGARAKCERGTIVCVYL